MEKHQLSRDKTRNRPRAQRDQGICRLLPEMSFRDRNSRKIQIYIPFTKALMCFWTLLAID